MKKKKKLKSFDLQNDQTQCCPKQTKMNAN